MAIKPAGIHSLRPSSILLTIAAGGVSGLCLAGICLAVALGGELALGFDDRFELPAALCALRLSTFVGAIL